MASIVDRILGGIGALSPATQEQAREIISAVQNQAKEIQKLMAKVGELIAAVQAVKDKIATESAEIAAKIQALKDQIAAGGAVKESDLDTVLAQINGLTPAIDALSESEAAPTPGPTP